LGEPIYFQVEEDKMLVEAPSSTIHLEMINEYDSTLVWKGEKEGR
jgi:hypothetical protein